MSGWRWAMGTCGGTWGRRWSTDSKELVIAISTSALLSPMSRCIHTPEACRVSPPLLRRRMRCHCSFSRVGLGTIDSCSPSDESNETSNKASTGSIVIDAVHFIRAAGRSIVCSAVLVMVVIAHSVFHRDQWQRYEGGGIYEGLSKN